MSHLDPYVFCPYDRNHYLPQSRLQAHIIKCELKYPPLQICPYNATHRIKKEDFKEHLENCDFKLKNFMEVPKTEITPVVIKQQVTSAVNDDDEDWDD